MSNKAKRGDTPKQIQMMVTDDGFVVLRFRSREGNIAFQVDSVMAPHQAAAMGKMLISSAQIAIGKKPIIVPGAGGKLS